MSIIALVSCTKSKQKSESSAEEMYMKSDWFKKVVNYIGSKNYDEWYILSAKHGLIKRDVFIEPYDVTLNTMRAYDRKAWSNLVFEELKEISPKEIDIYASVRYREYLLPLLDTIGIKYRIPLMGLSQGQQKSYLKQHINN